MVGRVLNNRYEILEEVGKGGMAYVYKARCKLLNRTVAIKMLRSDLEGDEEFLKRFKTEATAAANLTHPNIVSIYDTGEDNGNHYIVMEYVDGISLKKYITENAPLDVHEALSIAYQISDALCAAHEKGIVHRDIKPHNILIDSDHRVKVADFGIARATTGSTMTSSDNILGSVHYISPEQARGGYVDCRTDLYSLGVVIYEMLTGKLPFENDTPLAVAMMHCNDAPHDMADYVSDIPVSVQKLTMKCLAKDVNERYQTAGELKSDLMTLIKNPDADIFADDDIIEKADNFEDNDDVDATHILPVVKDNAEIVNTNNNDKPIDNEKRGLSKQKTQKESKKIFAGALATAFVIVGLLSLLATYVFFPDAAIFSMFKGGDINVPDFYSRTLDEAKALAKKNNLKVEVKQEKESNDVDENCVISQSPKKGKSVKKKTTVFLVISKGAKTIRLEDYTGKTYKEAKLALDKLGFTVKMKEQNDNDVEENHIIKQVPAGGEYADYGSTVTLYVSTGIENRDVVVPRLVGETFAHAKKILEQNELTLGDISYEKSVLDKGTVIRQSIGAGESCNVKTSIDLVISNGDDDSDSPTDNKKPSDSSNSSQTQTQQKEKLLSISLPADREQVTLKITANGAKIYEGIQYPKNNPDFSLKVKGTSQTTFEIYFDGVLHTSETIDFSK